MTGNFVVTEPSPSTTSYMRYGRGGAGNTFRPSVTSAPSSSVPANVQPTPRRFFSGVGGAGNVHAANERPSLSLDDEARRLAREEQTLGHTGIGGAGNVYRRKTSDASDAASDTSSFSSRSKLWARLSSS